MIYINWVIDYNYFYIDKNRIKWMNEYWRCENCTNNSNKFLLLWDDIVRYNVYVNDFNKRMLYEKNCLFTKRKEI